MYSLVTAGRSALSPWYNNRKKRKNIIAYNGRGGLGIIHTTVTAGLLSPQAPSPRNTGTPCHGKCFPGLRARSSWGWLRRLLHVRCPPLHEAAVGVKRTCPYCPQSCCHLGLAQRRQLALRAAAVRGPSISIAHFCFPWLQRENNSQSAVG